MHSYPVSHSPFVLQAYKFICSLKQGFPCHIAYSENIWEFLSLLIISGFPILCPAPPPVTDGGQTQASYLLALWFLQYSILMWKHLESCMPFQRSPDLWNPFQCLLLCFWEESICQDPYPGLCFTLVQFFSRVGNYTDLTSLHDWVG